MEWSRTFWTANVLLAVGWSMLAGCSGESSRSGAGEDEGASSAEAASAAPDSSEAAADRKPRAKADVDADPSSKPAASAGSSAMGVLGEITAPPPSMEMAGNDLWGGPIGGSKIGDLSGTGLGGDSGALGDGFNHPPKTASGQTSKLKLGSTVVSGRLPKEVIQRIVRQGIARFRLCYEEGLRSDDALVGRVEVRFVIDAEGSVASASGDGTMPDGAVVSCVTKTFRGLTFPKPEDGVVSVTYPIDFRPATMTLDGTRLEKATHAHLKKAIAEAEGKIDQEQNRGQGVAYDITRAGDAFTVLFIPATAGKTTPADDERARLLEKAAVIDDGVWLSVEHADRKKAGAMLNALIAGEPTD